MRSVWVRSLWGLFEWGRCEVYNSFCALKQIYITPLHCLEQFEIRVWPVEIYVKFYIITYMTRGNFTSKDSHFLVKQGRPWWTMIWGWLVGYVWLSSEWQLGMTTKQNIVAVDHFFPKRNYINTCCYISQVLNNDYSYGHLSVITGYKWDYIFYWWIIKYL